MIAACRAIDRVLLWQYYQIPLDAVDLRRTVHWDKFGIPDFEAKYWPAFPDGWWYDEAKAARIVNDREPVASIRQPTLREDASARVGRLSIVASRNLPAKTVMWKARWCSADNGHPKRRGVG